MSFSGTLNCALEACLRTDDTFKPTIEVVKELLELLEAYKADTRCPALPPLAANWTSKLEFVIENWRSIKNYLSDMGEQENWRSMKAGLRMIHSNVSQAFLPPEAQQGFQTVVEKLRSVENLIQKLSDPSTSLFRGVCLIGDFLENEAVLPDIERASLFILNYFGWLRRFDPPAYQDTDEWIRENVSGIATDIQRFNDRRVADGIPAVPLDAGASTLVDYFNRDGEHADISVSLMKKMTAFQYWRQKHSSDAFAKYIFWSTICPCNVDEARDIFRGPVTPEKTFCRGLIRWKLNNK